MSNTGGGAYTMPDATTTTVDGTISLPATNSLAVLGDLFTGATSTLAGVVTANNGGTINIGTGDITFDGNVTLTDGSIISDVVGDGTVTIGSGSTLALAANTGILNFGASTDLVITGAITNASASGANLLFDCLSTVTYDGAAGQFILPTPDVAGNRYGNLVLTTADKVGGTATYGNNVNICTNFSLAGGDLDMRTNSGYLQMNSAVGTVTYGGGSGTEEVLGAFRRKLAASGDVALATPYTFNNYKTRVTFTALPTASASAYYELNIDRDQSPINYIAGTDINRKITVDYDLAGAFEYTLQAGYLLAETPGGNSTFTSPLTEADLKFFEADGALPADVEKVAGTGYSRNATDPIRHVSLSGLIGGTGAVDGVIERFITPTNDLVLRASNTMISIVNGRWSNPNVWDEGRIPVQSDNVEIRTMVYVGIDGPFAGTSGGTDDVPANNTRSEAADYTAGAAAANSITIGDYPATFASLIIGNEDNGAYTHKTLSTGTSFINNNLTAPAATFPLNPDKSLVLNATGFNGLWITGFVTGATPGIPTLGTVQLQNSGSVNNQGIIEIGQ
jgi:hypothetical protein